MSSLNNITVAASIGATVYSTNPGIANQAFNYANTSTGVGGSAAGQSDGLYSNPSISVVSGTPYVLNLLGTFNDIYGNPITAAHVVGIELLNTSGTGNLTIGGGTDPLFAASPFLIEPGGKFVWDALTNGGTTMPVAGSTENFKVATSTGTSTFALTILTRST